MLRTKLISSSLLMVLAAASMAQTKSMVVAAYPWTFVKGTDTARKTALDTVVAIADHRGAAVVSKTMARDTAKMMKPPMHSWPTTYDLSRFAKKAGATMVLYGKVSWHTRSIWVGTGPKTISTATVDVYAYNAKTNKVSYSKKGVEGRSDEKENTLKDVGAVLLTPLVTVVSGGPATPREQRAVQIALARAYKGMK